MKHLIVCREYPPAPSGGIGTYVYNISRLLAQSGETVHVIGQACGKARKTIEEQCGGKLIIHRLPFEDRVAFLWPRASSLMRSRVARELYASDFPPRCFSWLAGALAERLVEKEGIDTIEAQDYEAPLYYFQLRRALGLGPKRRPPCFVHLHSPTEFIARYNEWDMARPPLIMAKGVEDFTIRAADAWLCASRYLARQAEVHYGLLQGSVNVIPYPLGGTENIQRDQGTWSNGSICYHRAARKTQRSARMDGCGHWSRAAKRRYDFRVCRRQHSRLQSDSKRIFHPSSDPAKFERSVLFFTVEWIVG